VDHEAAKAEYGIDLTPHLEEGAYDAVVLAVGHRQFAEKGSKAIRALGKPQHVFFDVKSLFPAADSDLRL
jgi:UDP-N-acetyl-D-galactosamine dehydrogenase